MRGRPTKVSAGRTTGVTSDAYNRFMRDLYSDRKGPPVSLDSVGRGLADTDKLLAGVDNLALGPAADSRAMHGDLGDRTHTGAAFTPGLTEGRCSDAQRVLRAHDPPLSCAIGRGRVWLGKIKRRLDKDNGPVPPDSGPTLTPQED